MIYVLSGGGTGGTLVVTGVAGDTVTATKDGKSYKRTFNASGIATFKGLKTGTWAITMTDGSQTVTQQVTITADYSLKMAYFSALITTTWPEGSTCSCTDGTSTLYAPDTSGSYTFNVPNKGTWTISCTNGDKTASKSVSITAEGQTEKVTLAYEYVLYNVGTQNVKFTNVSISNGNGYASVNFGSSSASMKVYNGTVSGTYVVAAIGSDAIDASPYTTLKMQYSISGSSGSGLSLSLSSSKSFSGYTALPSGAIASTDKSATSDSGTLSVDLSKYTSKIGSVYCCVGLICSSYEGTSTMTVSKIWLD